MPLAQELLVGLSSRCTRLLVVCAALAGCVEGHVGTGRAPGGGGGGPDDPGIRLMDGGRPSPTDAGGRAPGNDAGSTPRIDAGSRPGTDAGPPPDDDLAYCVSLLNMYRDRVGQPPLMRDPDIEAYAAEGARSDSQTGFAHGHFSATGGGGVAYAENEIPGWDLSFGGGTVRGVIEEGTQMMWEEGPGGGHYENIVGDYSHVGCGIHVTAGDSVWVVQDFR
jgi:hypothetical protein